MKLKFNICIDRYEYELVIVRGLFLNDTSPPVIRRTAKEPPILVNPEDLGGENSAGQVYTMGVRLKSKQVSPFFIDNLNNKINIFLILS